MYRMYFVVSHFECSNRRAQRQHSFGGSSIFFTAETRFNGIAFSLVGLLLAAAVHGGVVETGGAETNPLYSTLFSPREAWKRFAELLIDNNDNKNFLAWLLRTVNLSN